ncbi:proteasome-interacting protein cic1 [Coemansia interrupta]|uniref:Proteasome-interacting protein cic1 n=1 Tax=Coemansia interrupta TaxID=1126814 RepID=A0A9W8HCA2_9FUNG|nr:proteasome-interacting protein cic1 [Coemansia interrupta]
MSLDDKLVHRASKALLRYVEKNRFKKSKSLLTDDPEQLHLIISTKDVATKERHKPYRIPLRHPMYYEDSNVCLIIKAGHEDTVEKIKELGIPQIKEILTAQQLKNSCRTYEARRELLASYDLFLADDRLLNSLPKLLGTKFFKAKKLPAPVNLLAKDLNLELRRALSSTFFRPSKGTCTAIRIGSTRLTVPELEETIEDVVKIAIKFIPRGWKNIQSISIKAGNTFALPVYKSLPEPPTAITIPGASDSMEVDAAQEEKPKPKKNNRKGLISRELPKSKSVTA